MRLCRFLVRGQDAPDATPRVGVVIGNAVHDVSAVLDELPAMRWPLPPGDQLIANLDRLRPQMEQIAADVPAIPLGGVDLKSPVANPGKLMCGTANWPEHNTDPLTIGQLMKVRSAIAGESDVMELVPDEITGHEVELAVVIGRTCHRVSEAEASSCFAGFVIGLDMTLQNDRLFSHNKAPDGYGVIGPWMVTADEIPDPAALTFRFWIDGELRQTGEFKNLVHSMSKLVSVASQRMTLYPGDVMFSGTKGVAPVNPGETMLTEIDGIGRMEVRTRERARRIA